MKIKFSVDQDYLPKKIHIIPSEDENADMLHEMSQNLYITNPVPEFIEDVKNGRYNHISDLEYDKILSVMKRLGLLFMMEDGQTSFPSKNIFDLLVALLYEYMLNRHLESSRIL